MNSSQEQAQRPGQIGDKVKPKVEAVPNPEGWRPYKPGLEINNHGALRTVPKT